MPDLTLRYVRDNLIHFVTLSLFLFSHPLKDLLGISEDLAKKYESLVMEDR